MTFNYPDSCPFCKEDIQGKDGCICGAYKVTEENYNEKKRK